MTLIEAVVGSAVMLTVFLAIFAAFQISIDLVFSTKAATSATALVNERMEYVRGLSYDAIGTQGGIPAGPIPQVEQMMLNGIPYTVSTLVQYVDDPVDGLDALDETGVTADYKIIRVSAHWMVRGTSRTTFAVTTISPTGIETLAAGGTLRINVFDTAAAPVSGASVRIVNSSVSPAVDVTVTTGTSGAIAFPGAPPGSGYQVTVTKTDYSSAQTYPVTTENQNPNPGHASVVDETTTTLSLSIDKTGTLRLLTFSPVGPGEFEDVFSGTSFLSATSSTEVLGGALQLEAIEGNYATFGTATSTAITPQYLSSWNSVSWNAVTPADTTATVALYYWNGSTYVLVPDSEIPGNSAGLTSGSVDISALSVVTYGTLKLQAALSSSDAGVTPEIRDWSVSYTAGPTPLADVDFDIRGAKTIGVSSQGAPLYKYDESHTTTQFGEWIIDPIEADLYTISLPSASPHTISEMCVPAPSVSPDTDLSVSVTLVDAVTNSLRVVAIGNGAQIGNATVTIVGGVNQNKQTSACGQAFFGGIPAGSYTVTVSAPGYLDSVETLSVTGSTVVSVALTAS
ncbi:carboxypeptidase-like regulatory domain-containing protein [Patescibacteria group bacterium]|nr:carboxypeptidase-like regulatory domain-containing protein [Patescibacteria group bacterium]